MVDRLAATRIWLTTARPPITWVPPESDEPAPAEESATTAATPLTRSIAIRLAAARVWVTTARPPITWVPPEPAELDGSAAAEAPALDPDRMAPIIAAPAESAEPVAAVAPIMAEPAEPVAAVTAIGLWDATSARAMVPEPASSEIVETTPEAGPAAIAATTGAAIEPAPDATPELAGAGAPVEAGPAAIAATTGAAFEPPETAFEPEPPTWAHFAGPTAWTPPVAAIAWPATLTAEAWPVVDPGTRAAGTWRSAGYRSCARRGTALDRALFASAALLGVAAAVIVAAGALPSAAAIVDLTALVPLAAAIVDLTALVPLAAAIIVAVLLGTLALGLAWLSRAVDNVPPLTGRTPWLSPRRVMCLSLVPGFHLVIPWMAVEDLATRVLPPGRASMRKAVRAWAVVLAAAQGLAFAAVTVAAPASSWLIVAALLAGALSAVLLFLVVRRLEDRASRVALMLGLGGSTRRRWPAFPEPEPVADEPPPALAPRRRSAGRPRRRRA